MIIFILNITFYYLSTDYKNFLQNLKYSNFNDDFTNDKVVNNENNNLEKKSNLNDNNFNINNNALELLNVEAKENEIIWKTKLWKNYLNILDKFEKSYNLNKIEINTKLFEITDEYPDYYYEYYSNDLTLYFFTTKTYLEIYDIFNYLQKELPFNINQVNNFWEKSFYINLNNEINDNYIRLVITENWITYWLKIKKSQYDNIKNILLNNI